MPDIGILKITQMNHLSRIFALFLIVSVVLFSVGCDGSDDPEKTEEEIQLDKLKAGEWTLISATDGTDRTSEYPNMKLSFSGAFAEGGTYSYSSSATTWPALSPWEQSGSWKFAPGNVSSRIIRLTDEQEMIYTLSNSDKQLAITFTYSGAGFVNGRVDGEWTFTFTRP